jgi:hypothetical protein
MPNIKIENAALAALMKYKTECADRDEKAPTYSEIIVELYEEHAHPEKLPKKLKQGGKITL